MSFQHDAHVAHQADEYIEMDTLEKLLKLYTDAFIQLGQADQLGWECDKGHGERKELVGVAQPIR